MTARQNRLANMKGSGLAIAILCVGASFGLNSPAADGGAPARNAVSLEEDAGYQTAEASGGPAFPASATNVVGLRDLYAKAEQFEREMRDFFETHGCAEFRTKVGSYLVGSPIWSAEPRGSHDRTAPRKALRQVLAYATTQQAAVATLSGLWTQYRDLLVRSHLMNTNRLATQGLSPFPEERPPGEPLTQCLLDMARAPQHAQQASQARQRHGIVLRLYQSVLRWLFLEYEFVIQDCNLALEHDSLLFEQPTTKEWGIADSPGVFSILVRAVDVEVIEEFWRRMRELDIRTELTPLSASLLRQHQLFLERVLDRGDLASSKATVMRALAAGAADLHDALYWNWVLYLYEGHPKGLELFRRICREALRRSIHDPQSLYQRLRQTSFPDNSECIWPRKRLSRFDPRLLDIADKARAERPLDEMARIQEQIHQWLRRGRLRGGGIAQYTGGRLHGMGDFLDFGVGGCEAFSSFVTAPLLSLGNEEVHPVFISRPYQPWGHWIAGLKDADQYYVCDGESVDFGPPKPVPQFLQATMKSASLAENRFVCLTFYSQTLASWEWEFMLVGGPTFSSLTNRENKTYRSLSDSRPR
jgi:hypothetical protein